MEMLHQIFITVIAALTFFILIVKFASSATVNNGDQDQLKSSKVETSTTKRKGKKTVRFAVDHDEFVINKPITETSKTNEFVINKVISEQSETKSVVFEQNEIEDVNKEKKESGIELKESGIELIDQKSSCEVNVGNCNLDDEKCVELMCDDGIDESVKEKEGLISEEDDSSDDDDWEGVERSDLEKVFAVAADYGKVDDNLQNVESDVQMQLYGLHKVATEGPCHEGQPMALKVSARAKWNAWQKLGNMNPDVAMEQYITLLSEKVPGWSQGIHDSVAFFWTRIAQKQG